ncbi:MAG TPA: VOC family protein [Acidimicrobiales bacterium]|nr:VOC family protein [Acidimicrobiales bacterium]HVC66778.1 VOC family protein [Acidimicrobiales bacterium]
MDWKLELVVVPVADQDRAKTFYLDAMGFDLLVDHQGSPTFRVIQATPPGSACSIALMHNPEAAGTAQGLHLVVPDIEGAHAELNERGAAPGGLVHFEAGTQLDGPDPEGRDYNSFFEVHDPDGNGWLVQHVSGR